MYGLHSWWQSWNLTTVLPDFKVYLKTTSANTETTPGPLCRYQLLSCCFFYSVAKSSQTLCNPMDCSTSLSGFPVLHHFPEFAQTHARRSQWCYPTISSSIVPFSSYLQSFPASGSFPVSRLFASDDRNIATSASASILPMNIQGWFLLRLTGWISVLFKRLSGVFSSTTSLSCKQLFILFHVSILSWPC